MKDSVWLTWEFQRRNESLSALLGAKLYRVLTPGNGIVRYLVLACKTIRVLASENPSIIFSQNPSMFLSLLSVLYGRLRRAKVVVDAHNVGVLFEHRNPGIQKIGQQINDFIMRSAYLIIVTNAPLAKYVEERGGRAYVLPDPFPFFEAVERKELEGKYNILSICTFAADEPYCEVIEAAKRIEGLCQGIHLYMTGNEKKSRYVGDVPGNITLTGFLPDREYVNLLFSADAVIDLTYRENCLVCGAYEAISAGKPLILSDTLALRGFFENSAVYTQPRCDDIVRNIIELVENAEEFSANVSKVRAKRSSEIVHELGRLKSMLDLE